MLDNLKAIFSVSSFVPYGHCYLWQIEFLGLYVTVDALIAVSYCLIVIALFYFVRQQQAEAELRLSQGRLQLALEASGEGLWDWQIDTGEVYRSWHYAEILGYNADELPNDIKSWKAAIHPDDCSRVLGLLDAYIQNIAPQFVCEYRMQTKSGEWKWIADYGKIVAWDKQGKPLRLIGTYKDISDRKQVELELEAQQAFLRQIIDVVPNNIFVKNPEGKLLVVNQASAKIHGTTVENMIGKRETDFNPNFSAAQLEQFLSVNRQVIETRQPYTDLSQSIMSSTGETRWYQTVVSPLTDIDGQVTGVIGATTDVTTLKQAEQALQQAKEAAEAANQAKSIFLANMSHELRTPLNVILGFVQAMQREPMLTSEQQENLHIIRRSGDHLLSLINDVLDLSKIEAGHTALEESYIDLIDLLRSLEQMFRQRVSAKGLHLSLELAPNLPQYVTIDANKLRQILINLLNNAIKFTRQGYVTLRVVAEYQAVKQATEGVKNQKAVTSYGSFPISHFPIALHFEVNDTGIGIEPTELEAIFSAFVQTQAGKISPEGTGLGLTISRKFVQMMGGEIIVRSILGQGSTFAFTLPVRVTQSVDRSTTSPHGQVIGLAPNQPIYRVLVVDDQPENRKLLVNLLTRIGLEVQEATNGQEAVTQWQRWKPHLIYMDIRMPILNGYEATQQIRAGSGGQAPIVIALTAQASSSDRTLALASGCNDYLTKPFQEEVLLSKMAEHLGLKYLCAPELSSVGELPVFDATIALHSLNLSVMPSSWIAALRRAAQLCDDTAIETLIEQIPSERASLIKGLRRLVQHYRFKQIVALTTSGTTDGHASGNNAG